MAKNKKKTLILNTLILFFCIVVIALYSLIPLGNNGKEDKYILTFDSNGGDAIAAIEISGCRTVKEPPNPTREGYIFVGWELDGKPFDFSEEVCGDAKLTAVWEEKEPDKKYITIYYQRSDSEETSPVTIEEGEIPEKPEDPTREGYVFVGWQVRGVTYSFDGPLNDGDIIVAVWEAEEEPEDDTEYRVSFNLNGGTVGGTCDDQTVKKGGTAKNVCKPTRDGYTLSGWSPRISTKINKDTTFIAQWKKDNSSGGSSSGGDNPSGGGSSSGSGNTTKPSYSITYKFNDGTTVSSCSGQTVQEGSGISPNCNASAPAHYNFDGGWSCPSIMPSGGATCTRKIKLKAFRVNCKKTGDSVSTMTCAPYLLEDGVKVSGSYTIIDDLNDTYTGGKSININEFNDIEYFTFRIGNISGNAAKGSVD